MFDSEVLLGNDASDLVWVHGGKWMECGAVWNAQNASSDNECLPQVGGWGRWIILDPSPVVLSGGIAWSHHQIRMLARNRSWLQGFIILGAKLCVQKSLPFAC